MRKEVKVALGRAGMSVAVVAAGIGLMAIGGWGPCGPSKPFALLAIVLVPGGLFSGLGFFLWAAILVLRSRAS